MRLRPAVPVARAGRVAGRGSTRRSSIPRTGEPAASSASARYTPELLPALREALGRQAPLHETLTALDPVIIGEHELRAFGDPARLLFNVNTPEDLERAEAMLAANG